jgi:hypothetical protein
MALRMIPQRTDTVVDFMPPPVPDGDAPMIMSNMSTSSVAFETAPMGTVLKPTVVMAVIA